MKDGMKIHFDRLVPLSYYTDLPGGPVQLGHCKALGTVIKIQGQWHVQKVTIRTSAYYLLLPILFCSEGCCYVAVITSEPAQH